MERHDGWAPGWPCWYDCCSLDNQQRTSPVHRILQAFQIPGTDYPCEKGTIKLLKLPHSICVFITDRQYNTVENGSIASHHLLVSLQYYWYLPEQVLSEWNVLNVCKWPCNVCFRKFLVVHWTRSCSHFRAHCGYWWVYRYMWWRWCFTY